MSSCKAAGCRPVDLMEQGESFTAAALRVARERFETRSVQPAAYVWGERGRRLHITPTGVWPDAIDHTVWHALEDSPSHLAVMVYAVREGGAWVTSPKGSWAMVCARRPRSS